MICFFQASIRYTLLERYFGTVHKIFLQDFPEEFPARFSRNNFPQDFPDPDWLAPHHPIPNAKFPPITAFLRLAFSLPPFPTRISHKIFLQDFPTRISCKNFPQDFSKLDPDWLAPHHPITNTKFPPITALLNRPTYHKRSRCPHHPFLKSYGNPKSMNKLTLTSQQLNITQMRLFKTSIPKVMKNVQYPILFPVSTCK